MTFFIKPFNLTAVSSGFPSTFECNFVFFFSKTTVFFPPILKENGNFKITLPTSFVIGARDFFPRFFHTLHCSLRALTDDYHVPCPLLCRLTCRLDTSYCACSLKLVKTWCSLPAQRAQTVNPMSCYHWIEPRSSLSDDQPLETSSESCRLVIMCLILVFHNYLT